MADPREQLIETLGNLDATNRGCEEAIADHLLRQLRGYMYYESEDFRKRDTKTVEEYLIAYAKILHRHGVVP